MCSTQWPIWHLKSDLSVSSVLKVFSMLFGIISTSMWLRGEPRSSSTTLSGHFPKFLPLQNLPGTFQFPKVLLFGSESWGFIYPTLKGVSLDSTQVWVQAAGRWERRNRQGFTYLLEQQVLWLEKEVPSLEVLGAFGSHCCHCHHQQLPSHSSSLHQMVSLGALSILVKTHFWVSGCLEFRPRNTGEGTKWGKPATSWVVLNSGLLPQTACNYLLFRVPKWLLLAFCPSFIAAFSGRDRVDDAYFILPRIRTNLDIPFLLN